MRAVEEHYSGDDLLERILAGLEAAGADIGALTVADLAPVDAFHIRGRAATEELAGLAQIVAGQRVLDAGCGIGGTSRYLAAELGFPHPRPRYAGRESSASPAVGTLARHKAEQAKLVDEALTVGLPPVGRLAARRRQSADSADEECLL